jgi:hypothetical protein
MVSVGNRFYHKKRLQIIRIVYTDTIESTRENGTSWKVVEYVDESDVKQGKFIVLEENIERDYEIILPF